MANIVTIKVLGSGCAKCHKLEAVAKEAVADLGTSAEVEHVTDFGQIVAYGVVATPALVVDGIVKSAGRVPSQAEVSGWVKEALAAK